MRHLSECFNEAVDLSSSFNEAVKQPKDVGMDQDDLYDMIDKSVKDNTLSVIPGRSTKKSVDGGKSEDSDTDTDTDD